MSHDEAVPNPYDSPPPVAEPKPGTAFADEPRMEYVRVFTYLFDHPNWMMIVLFGGLCFFSTSIIPIVGALVFTGYQFEVAEALICKRGKTFPDFDFNRFSDYLMRGVWPFLVTMVVTLLAFVPIGLMTAMFVCGGALAGSLGDAFGSVVVLLLVGVGTIAVFAMSVLMMLVAVPMLMRAGLMQEFGEAFKFEWVKDFIRRTWREMLLFAVVMMCGGVVLSFIGLLIFCVGSFAAQAVMALAQAHMYYQLYELYLARGGEPIPFKEPAAA